jgi:hypothetical protein
MGKVYNEDTQNKFETIVPTVFRNVLSPAYASYFYEKFVEIFNKYRGEEKSTTAINVVHFHHLYKDPQYKEVVLDYISAITKSEAFDFSTGIMSDSIAYSLTISQLRVQYPKTQLTHVPLHQDLSFTGTDYPVVNCWVPLVDCAEDAPGLEFVDRFIHEDLSKIVEKEKSDYEMFSAIDLTSHEAFLRQRYGGDLVAPVLKAGDALLFDQLALHRTYITPTMTKPRFSLELRGFAAEHMFRDPDRWLHDRVNGDIVVATKGRDAVYLSYKSVSRIVTPSREVFQFTPERRNGWDGAEKRMDELLRSAEDSWGSTRDRSMLPTFMASEPYRGRCYVYPLGADTRSVVPILAKTPGLELLGVVDRRAETLPPFENQTMLTPDELASKEYDFVLVPHILPQQVAELTAQLRRAGVPADKIVDVYADPRFAAFADRKTQENVAALLKDAGPVDYVVLCEQRSYIMGKVAIRSLLPPERTVVVVYGAVDPSVPTDGYRVIGANSGIPAVRAILQLLRPRTVLVRSSVGAQFLGYVVRRALPEARLVHEMYDLWLSLAEMPVARLATVFGVAPSQFELNRMGEEFSLRHADLIVSKRFGEGWNAALPEGGGAYAPYYPLLETDLVDAAAVPAAPAAAVGRDRPLALVDATALMPLEMVRQNSDVLISYAPFEMMESVAALERVTFDVFNGFHQSLLHDKRYADYLTRYASGSVRYHRGMPESRLIPKLAEFDYGWINVAVPLDHPDAPHVALSRFTCYVAAGLPVIVNARLKHAAALTERFDAGIVVADYTVEATRAALRKADPGRHRQGVLRLREFMLEENRRTLETIRGYL